MMSDDFLLKSGKKRSTGALMVALGVLVALGAIGGVGQLAGAGWFGYRQILYGVNEIYLLNMGSEKLQVSVAGRELIEVEPQGARLVEVMGGDSEVSIHDADGVVRETRTVFTDHSSALLKLSADGCLAISDVGALYGRGGDGLNIIQTIDASTRLYVPESKNIIWPRKTFPRALAKDAGQALWIELVGCALLDEPRFMRGYLDTRLGERLAKERGDEAPGAD